MRIEESELLVDLYRGAAQSVPWQAFLQRLAQRCQAGQVTLMTGAGTFGTAKPPFDADVLKRMRLMRVYGADELGENATFGRILRADGDVWLYLGRQGRDFTASVAALMSALGPHLAVAAENQRGHSLATAYGTLSDQLDLRRQTGWMTLSAGAVILMASTSALQVLARSETVSGQVGSRLVMQGRDAKTLSNTVQDYAHGFHRDAVALKLDDCEVLLTPFSGQDHAGQSPVAMAILRWSGTFAPSAARALADMVHITQSEARFALKLAEGLTIAEAGAALGLTLQTARNYSKMIYGKLNMRGQNDLIRFIENSVIRLI